MDTDQGPEANVGTVSIQWCEAAPGPCVRCEDPVGSGPVGFTQDEPSGAMCDGCLLEANKDLGMMIMMAHVTRELAIKAAEASEATNPWQADHTMLQMMLFAKMYHKGATWDRRPIAATEFVAELHAQFDRIPLLSLFLWSNLQAG